MSRANIDVRRTVLRTRTQTASIAEKRLLLQSSNSFTRLPESQSTLVSKRNKEVETQDINQLLDIIENQRGSLEQRAAIIQTLQSDINAMGKLLVEERSKAAHYNQMYIIAEKEKEASKKTSVPETKVTLTGFTPAPQVEKKLAQENFLLKTDLDNIQHQLSLKKLIQRIKGGQENEHLTVAVSQIAELNNRMEEYENISQLLQSQVVWLNREHTKLTESNAEKDAHIRELDTKLQQATTDSVQKSDSVDRLNVELANRRLELEKRSKEVKELKETVSYLQQMSDHHSYQIQMSTFNEDELKRKIQYFKTEALTIADKLGSAQRDKSMLEEKFRGQQQAREDLMMSVELLRKQQQEEKNRLRSEIEETKQTMKAHTSSVLELEAELQKRGEGHDRLNFALKTKQDELDRLNEEAAVRKTEIAVLQRRLADADPYIRAAKAQVLKLEAELTQAEIQTADYEQLQQDNEVLKDRCFVLDRERSTLQKVLDDAASKIEAMGQELAKEKTHIKDSEADLQELKKEALNVHTLKSACQQLQMLLGQAQEDKRMMAITLSKKTQECEEGNSLISELRHSMERLQQTNAELKEETDRSIALLQIKLPEMKEIEEKLVQVHEREESVKTAINRAANATRAIESDLCCIVCLSLVQEAVVCVPCGHFYCKKCREGYHPHCQQCGQGKKVKVTMRMGLVDDIVGKVRYRKQAISSVA